MKRAEFDWLPVLGALMGADLSGQFNDEGYRRLDPQPTAWPSEEFARRHASLCSRINYPEKKRGREYGITVAELEAEIDWLFADLAQAEAPEAEVAERWELAARWLREAKRRARRTQVASGR